MKTFLKLIFVALAVFSSNLFAQGCVIAPQIQNQGQRCYDGRVIIAPPVQNTYSVAPIQNRYAVAPIVYQNEQQMLQQMVQNNGGQVIGQQGGYTGYSNNEAFQIVERTRSCNQYEQDRHALHQGFAGAVIGGLAGLARGENRNAAGKGALIGAVVLGGLAEIVPCTVTERIRVPVAQQQGIRQAVNQQGGTVQCKSFGMTTVNDCITLMRGDKDQNSSTSISAESITQEAVSTQAPIKCDSGLRAEKLNWEGHHQNGNWVCIPEGERNDGPRRKNS